MDVERGSLAMSVLPYCCEVRHFVAYDRGYYAILRTGERFNITFIHTFQPAIADFDDYFTFLFIQTDVRFFILRQRILEGRAEGWESFVEVVPEERAGFFRRAAGEPGFLEGVVVEAGGGGVEVDV